MSTPNFQLPTAADISDHERARQHALAAKTHEDAAGAPSPPVQQVQDAYSPDPEEVSATARATEAMFGAPGADGSYTRPAAVAEAAERADRTALWTAIAIIAAAVAGAAMMWAYGEFVGASGTVTSTTTLDTNAGIITVEPDGTVTGPRGVVVRPDGTVGDLDADGADPAPAERPTADGDPAGDPADTGRGPAEAEQ